MNLARILLDSCPADLALNSRWRLRLFGATGDDCPAIYRACADGVDGFLLFCNAFGWVNEPRGDRKHLPFVMWPIQRSVGSDLWKAIDTGQDVLIDKSRDMGASWLCLYALFWWWMFREDTPLKVVSRKEELVDRPGDPDTLLWKLDYILSKLPKWLTPRVDRSHMHLANLDNGSSIDGESTNADVGRGGRKKAMLLDEFAAVENGNEVLAATADTTPCRIFNSTPKGRGNAFADVRFSGKVQVLTLHWKDHPDKGRDAQLIEVDGKQRWMSPWYQTQLDRRVSRKEVAQELDIDYLASGDAFFDLDVCQRMRAGGLLSEPKHKGALRYKVDTLSEGERYKLSEVQYHETGLRRLGLWLDLINGRPPQNDNYVLFADISAGTGASNSVIKIASVNRREEIGAYVCPDTPPHDLARVAVGLCQWLGGEKKPLLGWEANGPGQMFGKEVWKLGYVNVLGNLNPLVPWSPEDNKIGWWSSRDKKIDLLGNLRSSLARSELILHDLATVTELEQYIYYPSGSVGPSNLVEEAEGARAAHGDRVIATAGLLYCLSEMPKVKEEPAQPGRNSYEEIKRAWKSQQRSTDRTW